MVALDGRNYAVYQIVWAVRVVLRVLVSSITTHREMGLYSYLLNRILGPQCSLVKALEDLVVTIDHNFSSFWGQIVTSHQCI